jgi:drug/metabolite transporter (DMT)-like permease
MIKPGASAYAMLFFQGAIWGSSFQAIKIALEGFGPITVAAGRIFLAAIIMTVYAISRGHSFPKQPRTLLLLGIVGLFNCALPFFLIPWGEQSLDSSRAAIFMATGPLMVLIIAHFTTTDERLNRFKSLGFMLGFIGVMFVIGLNTFKSGFGELLPQLAIITAAISYAVSGAIAKKVEGVSSSMFTACVLIAGSILTVPASLLLESPFLVIEGQSMTAPLLALIYLGIMPTGLAFMIRFHLIKTVGYTFVSQVGYLVPVFGVLFGAVLLNETISLSVLIGLTLILSGILISRKELASDLKSERKS